MRFTLGNEKAEEDYKREKSLQKYYECCGVNKRYYCTCPVKTNHCHLCKRKLVSIGHARVNGRDHPDWDSRQYHKKCWTSLQDE